MNEIKLVIITHEGVVFEHPTVSVRLCASDGSVGIHAGHCSALIGLVPGGTEYDFNNKTYTVFTGNGFATVSADEVRVITDRCSFEEGTNG